MDAKELLEKLNEELAFERPFNETDKLNEIDEWDSLALLGVLNVFDDLGIEFNIDELESCKSISAILSKALI